MLKNKLYDTLDKIGVSWFIAAGVIAAGISAMLVLRLNVIFF